MRKACIEIAVLIVLIAMVIIGYSLKGHVDKIEYNRKQISEIEGVFESLTTIRKVKQDDDIVLIEGTIAPQDHSPPKEVEMVDRYLIKFADGREIDFANMPRKPIEKGQYIKIYYNYYGIQDIVNGKE